MDSKVLDASAFYAGIPFRSDDTWYTTPAVYDEVKHIRKNQGILEARVDTNRLQIREPGEEFVQKATEASKKTGDFQQLSSQDISILALGLELGGQVITDDFGISNVARHLKIQILPIMTSGIKDAGTWIQYCPGCRQNFKNKKRCPLCDTMLKRKLLKR